jgi:hypothetical protein
MRKIEQISISTADRERLERLVQDRNTPQKVVWRARIVLLASDGLTATAIAAAAGKSVLTVRRWRRRYMGKGVDGLLKDATRPSRVKPLTPEKIKQVVHMTLHEKPANATHWSLRSIAPASGISKCCAPARDAAPTRFPVASSSPLLLPAQCTMISAPSTAGSIPSHLSKSPVTYSMPSPDACWCRLSTLMSRPASRKRRTTWRPNVPVPPVTKIGETILPPGSCWSKSVLADRGPRLDSP